MGSRYREDESLLSLNIVELTTRGKDIKIYKLTDFGKEIMGSLRK